jgi:hypothetical protein
LCVKVLKIKAMSKIFLYWVNQNKGKKCVRDAEGGEAGTALNGAKRSEGIAEAKAKPEAARPEPMKYLSLRGRKPEAIS